MSDGFYKKPSTARLEDPNYLKKSYNQEDQHYRAPQMDENISGRDIARDLRTNLPISHLEQLLSNHIQQEKFLAPEAHQFYDHDHETQYALQVSKYPHQYSLPSTQGALDPAHHVSIHHYPPNDDDAAMKGLQRWLENKPEHKSSLFRRILFAILITIFITGFAIGSYAFFFQLPDLQNISSSLEAYIGSQTNNERDTQIIYTDTEHKEHVAPQIAGSISEPESQKQRPDIIESQQGSGPVSQNRMEMQTRSLHEKLENVEDNSALTKTDSMKNAQSSLDCPEADINIIPLRGGLSRISIHSPCRNNQIVQILYAGFQFDRSLNNDGHLDFILDCFEGDRQPVTIKMRDGTSQTKQIAAKDLEAVSKVAVLWKAPLDLNLHAFEYSAADGQEGHMWSGRTRNFDQTRTMIEETGLGRGFISSSDAAGHTGDKLEVYTFINSSPQPAGVIKIALSYEKAEAADPQKIKECTDGKKVTLDYTTTVLVKNQVSQKDKSAVVMDICSGPYKTSVRLNSKAIPDLIIGNESKN